MLIRRHIIDINKRNRGSWRGIFIYQLFVKYSECHKAQKMSAAVTSHTQINKTFTRAHKLRQLPLARFELISISNTSTFTTSVKERKRMRLLDY